MLNFVPLTVFYASQNNYIDKYILLKSFKMLAL